jgi:hypothetical protein
MNEGEWDAIVDGVIVTIAALWPGCHMVKGLPFHSSTNGGVERFNQTIQKKIKLWMEHNWLPRRVAMWVVLLATL